MPGRYSFDPMRTDHTDATVQQHVQPTGSELASIIILCCNELSYTRQCLESVFRYTRLPYELVLVDNGSNDGTRAYLDEVRSRYGPTRIEILRNETNRGFPAGCNQGLACALGRYLVFLNNDTIVTEGWLEDLIAWSVHDWPKVGMVGPVTNYTRPPQQIPADYRDQRGLEAFAARRRRDYARKAMQVERLTGFCLLVRREVLEQVGGFDERFGLGFFDDDDLSVRARENGFQLFVALNVFIHHFGSRTFTGLGIDCPQQLQSNFDMFRAKWGPEHSAGYRLPEPAEGGERVAPGNELAESLGSSTAGLNGAIAEPLPFTTDHAAAPSVGVSLCMIVRNEERNLPACLGSVAGLVDEIILVDTGSTDRTKEIAADCGARVFDFPWVDSFAAARNESLRHATGQWIFWLDADDHLDEDNRGKLRRLFEGLRNENAAYSMKCLCFADSTQGAATVVDHIRLFRNHPQLRWEYRVHEQILGAVRRLKGEVRFSDVVIHHSGYQDPALRGRKLERDLRLLQLEDADRPDDPFTLFNLGSIYNELRRFTEALPLLRRSLERSHPSDSIVRKLFALIVQCHRQLGQPKEALEACRTGRGYYPDDTELLFTEGMMRRELGDRVGAETCFLQLLQSKPSDHFASIDAGLRGYKTRHNLAVLYREQGRLAEAGTQWQAALSEQPDYLPCWLGIAELHLAQGCWDELEQTAQRIDALTPGSVEGAVLRSRAFLARKEFANAQRLLEETIALSPQALWPRVILSHVLLQEGRDLAAAGQALRNVLALDPTHEEARQNLALLLRQAGVAANAVLSLGQPGNDYAGCNEPLLRAVPPTARRILVIGCGAGNMGAKLKQKDPSCQIFSIELEPGAAIQDGQKLDWISTIDIETEDLPIDEGGVDCILYDNVLEHIHKPGEVLRRHSRYLTQGGIILCSVANIQHFSVIEALLKSDFQYIGSGLLGATKVRFFTYSTLIKLLLDAGFAPEIVDEVRTTPPEQLSESLRPLLDHLALHRERTLRYLSACQYVVKGTRLPFDNKEAKQNSGCWEDKTTEEPLTFVACVSDETSLRANLLSSPCLGPESPHEVLLVRNCQSAAEGLNRGLAQARNPLVVCLHQDVYLPSGWPVRLVHQYRLADSTLGRIGVLGVYGVSCKDSVVSRAGHVVDRDRLLREGSHFPAVVDTLDELLLVIPKAASLSFDPRLGFHFYGADVCLSARQRGLTTAVVDALCFHHSQSVVLPGDFWTSAQLFADKWSSSLPLTTSCVVIEKDGTMRLS